MTSKERFNIYGTRSRSLTDSNIMLKGQSDVKQGSGDGGKSLLEGKPLCFYLLTDDYSSAPPDLKTHITVNKVSWGAF